MCTRYNTKRTLVEAAAKRGITIRQLIRDTFNVAPTTMRPIVRSQELEDEEARWGLVPHWSKTLPDFATFNARIETVATLASFRTPWRKGQRCIIPLSGFYEWRKEGPKVRRPFYFSPVEDEVLFFAGLWDRAVVEGVDILSYTVLVGPPFEPVAKVHDRQAVILPDSALKAWVDPKIPSEDFRPILGVPSPVALRFWEVGQAIGNSRVERPGLDEPVDPA